MKTLHKVLFWALFCCLINPVNTWAQIKNIAKGKSAEMSTVMSGMVAKYAVDGTTTEASMESNNVIITALSDQSYAWWQVDLGAVYDISKVVVYKCSDCTNKDLLATVVAVSPNDYFDGHYDPQRHRNAGHWNTNIRNAGNPISTNTYNAKGRYVRIWKAIPGQQLTLAEVEVFGTLSAEAVAQTVAKGDKKQVTSLVRSGQLSAEEAMGTAIINNDIGLVQELLKENKKVTDHQVGLAFNESAYKKDMAHVMVTKGELSLNKKMLSTAINNRDNKTAFAIIKKEKTLVDKSHVSIALKNQNKDLAYRLMGTGVTVGTAEVKQAVDMGDEAMVRTMIDDNGGRVNADMLNSAISSDNSGMINLIMPKVKPNSQSYVLAAQKNDLDLYMDLVGTRQLSDNRSIEIAIDKNNKDILLEGLRNGGDANKALDYALTKKNHMAIEKCMARKGVKVEKAIPYVVENEDKDLADLMLNKYNVGADKILDQAVTMSKNEMIKMAVETGNAKPTKHLVTMISRNEDDLAKLMVDNGADANKGMTDAIRNNKVGLLDYFINDGGASVDDANYMETACANPNSKMAELLVAAGADANNGLDAASRNGHLATVKFLLENGADANIGLVSASHGGHAEVVAELINNGASPDAGIEPAVKANHTETVKILLENGAPAMGVIQFASSHGNAEVVQALIDNGADANKGLHAACQKGHVKVLNTLIENGADASDGSYMVDAVSGLHAAIIPILFNAGVDPAATYPDGGTFIHKAASMANSLNAISALVDGGVDANAQDNLGNTALHYAVKLGKTSVPMIQALVAAGNDVNALNNNGETPLKVAKQRKTKSELKKLGGVKKVK